MTIDVASAETTTRAKLLVIDDELGPRESLRIVFKNEYDVLLADSVDVGLALLQAERPDAIIMDIKMPGKTGIDGLQEIRRVDPHISVVMLTGFGALDTAQQAIRLGANDYLKKPFDAREIFEVIRRNVQRTVMERRRANLAEEVRQLNAELVNELTEKEHMATLGQASSEFMHDLRNPLTVVHGYAQLLEEQLASARERLGEDSAETFEYLNIISRNVQRCYEITEMWRNVGRHSGKVGLVRLVDVVNEAVRNAEPLAACAGATVRAEIGDDSGQVFADPLQIFRVLQNLVANALHALPEQGGEVRVSCGVEDGYAYLRVEDNGCGMSPESQARIFEPYYTTKDLRKGTGLGLAITKKVVENHDGFIEVASQPGRGSVFTVRLPQHGPA